MRRPRRILAFRCRLNTASVTGSTSTFTSCAGGVATLRPFEPVRARQHGRAHPSAIAGRSESPSLSQQPQRRPGWGLFPLAVEPLRPSGEDAMASRPLRFLNFDARKQTIPLMIQPDLKHGWSSVFENTIGNGQRFEHSRKLHLVANLRKENNIRRVQFKFPNPGGPGQCRSGR
jgi:hypothetical protein